MDVKQPEYALAARDAAAKVLAQHRAVALMFSGGKDSLATLHLLRPWWGSLTVIWVNGGVPYPETVELMNRIREMVPSFIEAKGGQPRHIATMGLPADVVPVRNTAEGKVLHPNDDVLLQPYWQCCAASLWAPGLIACRSIGATLLVNGQRRRDARRGPPSGYSEDGMTRFHPIEGWTTEQVFAYLRAQNVEIPKHYEYTETSLDCSTCTAFLDENLGRMRYTKEKHPDIWRELHGRLKLVADAIQVERQHLEAALQLGERA